MHVAVLSHITTGWLCGSTVHYVTMYSISILTMCPERQWLMAPGLDSHVADLRGRYGFWLWASPNQTVGILEVEERFSRSFLCLSLSLFFLLSLFLSSPSPFTYFCLSSVCLFLTHTFTLALFATLPFQKINGFPKTACVMDTCGQEFL